MEQVVKGEHSAVPMSGDSVMLGEVLQNWELHTYFTSHLLTYKVCIHTLVMHVQIKDLIALTEEQKNKTNTQNGTNRETWVY